VAAQAHLVRAFLAAAGPLSQPPLRQQALDTLALLYRSALDPDGRVGHVLEGGSPPDLLDDHAQLGLAALAAFVATGEPHHRAAARTIADRLHARFAAADGGFFDVPAPPEGPPALATFRRPIDDTEAPSGNALAFALLAGLNEPRDQAALRLLPSLYGNPTIRQAGLLFLARTLATGAS
jgi:uncharacterized protein YyaL (SSP411 family)